MTRDELQKVWRSGGGPDDGGAWAPARVAALRSRRSRSVSAFLGRLLAWDLALKAATAIGLAVAAWLSRHDAAGLTLALLGLAAVAGLYLPVARARRTFVAGRHLDDDVRAATAGLLADLSRFRRVTLPAVAATGSLLVLAWCVAYFAVEYGAFGPERPEGWAVVILCIVAPFAARMAVVSARLRAAVVALSACLADLDAEALAAIGREDARAQRVLMAALLLVLGLLYLGVVVSILVS